MAKGDQANMFQRIKALIPRWFSDTSPVFNALLQGFAYAKSYVYGLILYARLQTRIKTATDGWLDMIAADFFGSSLKRRYSQNDASFRNQIIINMLRERATRTAIVKVLKDLTGREPLIFEPSLPQDTGALNINFALGISGRIGSLMPYQAFVTAYQPLIRSLPEADIYAAIDSVKPIGTIVWTRITK